MTIPALLTVVVPLPDVPYKVTVKRQVSIQLRCPGVTGNDPSHDFLATFDEVQRYIACPMCGAQTEVPVQYRGQP